MTPKKGDCSTLHCPVIQQDLSMRAEKGKWEELLLCHKKIFSGDESRRIFPGETPNDKTVKRP